MEQQRKRQPVYYFCTYFDQNYLPRGLALYESLRQHGADFRLFILCLDQPCYQHLASLQLPQIELVSIDELEQADRALAEAKHNRSQVEYYFTCTPAFTLYLLERFAEVDLLTYVDADMYFFGDPAPVFCEIADASVAFTAHRYAPPMQDLNKYGEYNVGWLSFRADATGLACLRWYRERCIEWCYDRLEGDRYADQKYLEHMLVLFPNVVVLNHIGVNAAPWNIANYRFRTEHNRVFVNDAPLIIFHFHGFKQKLNWLFDTHTARYQTRPSTVVREHVYGAYVKTLTPLLQRNQLQDGVRTKTAQSTGSKLRKAHRIVHYIQGALLGQYLVYMPSAAKLKQTLALAISMKLQMSQLVPVWIVQAAEMAQILRLQ